MKAASGDTDKDAELRRLKREPVRVSEGHDILENCHGRLPAWATVKDGLMTISAAQFDALFAGLDWHQLRLLQVATPQSAE